MKYQFIRHGKWQGIKCFGIKRGVGLALIYDWVIYLGFLEIRKWHKLKKGDIEETYKETLTEKEKVKAAMKELDEFVPNKGD